MSTDKPPHYKCLFSSNNNKVYVFQVQLIASYEQNVLPIFFAKNNSHSVKDSKLLNFSSKMYLTYHIFDFNHIQNTLVRYSFKHDLSQIETYWVIKFLCLNYVQRHEQDINILSKALIHILNYPFYYLQNHVLD